MTKPINLHLLFYFLIGNIKRSPLKAISTNVKSKPDLDIRKSNSPRFFYLTANFKTEEGDLAEEVVALIDKEKETLQVIDISKLEKENVPLGKAIIKWANALQVPLTTVTQFKI